MVRCGDGQAWAQTCGPWALLRAGEPSLQGGATCRGQRLSGGLSAWDKPGPVAGRGTGGTGSSFLREEVPEP